MVLTFFFLMIIMGATDRRAPSGFAPIAIGLGLTLIHLIGIPVTNLSVNPARSTGPAIFVGGWALAQLWLFWVAPIIGGTLGGALYAGVFESETARRQLADTGKSIAAVAPAGERLGPGAFVGSLATTCIADHAELVANAGTPSRL